jgi:plastocyanin
MKFHLTNIKWLFVLSLMLAVALTAACSSAASPSPAGSTTPGVTTPVSTTSVPATSSSPVSATTSPASSSQAVVIDLVASNMAFDKNTLTVPAGVSVTINFNNKDSGIPHNFAVYQNLAGGQTKPVFVGDVITGPKTITYKFTAPSSPGSYFFECDIHPQVMTGTFSVTP